MILPIKYFYAGCYRHQKFSRRFCQLTNFINNKSGKQIKLSDNWHCEESLNVFFTVFIESRLNSIKSERSLQSEFFQRNNIIILNKMSNYLLFFIYFIHLLLFLGKLNDYNCFIKKSDNSEVALINSETDCNSMILSFFFSL